MISFFQKKTCFLKVILLVAATLILSACADDESVETHDSYIWAACLVANRGDHKVELSLVDPRPFSLYAPPGPSNPEYFEIWISDDDVNYSFFKKVGIETTHVEVPDLSNGKSYYFYVSSHKGSESIKSATVMTIPSVEPKSEAYQPNMDFSPQRLSLSYDQKYIAYTNSNSLYVRSTTPSGTTVPLGYHVYGANWSEAINSMAYFDSKQEGNTIYPNQLILHDPETNASTALLQVAYQDYYAMSPSFRPNHETVAFLSNEGNSQEYVYDVWTVDPSTLKKEQLSNFQAMGFVPGEGYDWSMSGDEIYLSGKQGLMSPECVYKFSLSTKNLTAVIQSAWGERRPSLSPDNTLLAFISGRTGADQLWTYNLVTGKYAQITSEVTGRFDSRYTNLQWVNNDQMLITIYKDDMNRALKINVR